MAQKPRVPHTHQVSRQRMMRSAASIVVPSLISRSHVLPCCCAAVLLLLWTGVVSEILMCVNEPSLVTSIPVCVQTQSWSVITAASQRQQLKLSGIRPSPPVGLHVGLHTCPSQCLSPLAICLKWHLYHFRSWPPSSPRLQRQAEVK